MFIDTKIIAAISVIVLISFALSVSAIVRLGSINKIINGNNNNFSDSQETPQAAIENAIEAIKSMIKNGVDGHDGKNGRDGKNGLSGSDGQNGNNGSDGEGGTDGQDGSAGEDGTAGTDGQDGSDGADGTAGEDGDSNNFIVTVGNANSGATYEVDGISDQVEIQSAIDQVKTNGGGVIKILSGVYILTDTIVVPKNPQMKIEGEYITKTGYGGSVLKASSSLDSNLEALVKEAGEDVANISNADHSHASTYSQIVFDGNNKADVGLLLINTDHTIVNDSKFVNTSIGIDAQFNGDVSLADYAGGLRVMRSSFYSSNINIRMNSHTQDWITDSWFLGTPNTHIHFIKSNKIHLSNNEFNTVSAQTFVFEDDGDLHCGDINITGGFINAGSGKFFWTDNRTNAASKGVVVAGVRFVQGTKTKLFNQETDFQSATYDASSIIGGYIDPNYNDDVILLNSASSSLDVRLGLASTATKKVMIKVINLDNEIEIFPQGSDSIEQNGVLSSSFTLSEVNESVWLLPDGNKWRVLSSYIPSGGSSSSSSNQVDKVVEVATNYIIDIDDDYLLVNAYSNPVTVTLPLKATKYSEDRKVFVIKVINANNTVTIQAAGSDQIDQPGQTSISINDTSATTFIANSGSRWRIY